MRTSVKLFLAVLVWVMLIPVSHAQVLEEIIVTAQKREQSLQDVALSVTAFTGKQLREMNVDSTVDLAAFVPGFTLGQNTGDGDIPFISLRAVTVRDFSDINESPSSVYIDGFYKANLVGLDQQLYDMQRVEVLRGPQGTLYGRNATGGLIHYVTAKPTSEWEGFSEFTVGEYDRLKFEGAIGGPISENLSGRLSVLHHSFTGWVENSVVGRQDGSALDAESFRAQLLYGPTDDLSFSAFIQHSSNDNDAGNMFVHQPARVDPVTGLSIPAPGLSGYNPTFAPVGYVEATPGNNRDTHSDRNIYLNTEQNTFIGTVNWNVNDFEIVSITGFEQSSKDATFDSDSTNHIFPRGTEVHPDSLQFSEEFRISGGSDTLGWLAGVYYIDYHIKGDQSRCLTGMGAPGCPVLARPVQYDLETDSIAVFGNVDYSFTDQLSLTLGVRYSNEEKEYNLNNFDTGLMFNTTLNGSAATQDDDLLSFNARLNWTVSENLLMYGGVSRGHKGGTFNLGYTGMIGSIPSIPVKFEQLTDYEGGFKADFMDGAARLNGSVFYYDYHNSQAFQFDGTTLSSLAFNSEADVLGMELEFAATPMDGLDLFATMTYLDATLRDVIFPGPAFTGLAPVDTDMPLAPDFKWSLLGRYEWASPFWGGGRLALQGDVTWYDDQFFDAFNSPSHFEDSYAVGNASLTWYSADDKWNVSVFAENIGDTEYRTFSFDLAFLGFSTDVLGKPRWAGGKVGYSW